MGGGERHVARDLSMECADATGDATRRVGGRGVGAVMGGCGACVGWVGMRRMSGELGSWISMNSCQARGRMLSCIGGEN